MGLLVAWANIAASRQVPPESEPRETSAIRAENLYSNDVNLSRIQASLPNGYFTPVLVSVAW